MVVGDGLSDVLQHHGLAGSWSRYDQPPLSLPNGIQEIDNSGRKFIGLVFQS